MEVTVLPSKNSLLIRALVNIVLGAILLIWPGITLVVLVYAFAINILLTGLVAMFEPAFDKKKGSVLTFLLGLLAVVAGIYLVARPGIAAELIALIIGLWAILFGLVDIFLGFSSKVSDKSNWLFVIVGILSVLLGIFVLANPLGTILTLVWVIGWYALIVGFVVGITALLFYPKSK
jgi:uncharacterized membrane protein HdeD (DUF308 family)